MKTIKLLMVLLSVLLMLSACLPKSASEEQQETTNLEEVITPEGQEKPLQSGAVENTYPAPGEEAVSSGDLQEPYPAPQESLMNESANRDPYPSIEVVGSASSLDLSEAITADEYTVVPDDNNLQAATVFVEHSEIILKDSNPVQVELVIVGKLPSPCHQLRVDTLEPDNTGQIKVRAYSVTDPEKACAQVLEPFIAVIPLGEYSEGTFIISINNEMTGEFVIP